MTAVRGSGAPDDVVRVLDYLFATVLGGRNASLSDGNVPSGASRGIL